MPKYCIIILAFQVLDTRYLLCPAHFPVKFLDKFIRLKFNLDATHKVGPYSEVAEAYSLVATLFNGDIRPNFTVAPSIQCGQAFMKCFAFTGHISLICWNEYQYHIYYSIKTKVLTRMCVHKCFKEMQCCHSVRLTTYHTFFVDFENLYVFVRFLTIRTFFL